MAKVKTTFFCSECGGESVRWMGQCPHCGAWNTLVEEKIAPEKPAAAGRVTIAPAQAQPLSQVAADAARRWQLNIHELDSVLGGGLTPGSSVLLGGEPGIGKSTLLLQAAFHMAAYGRVLYVSGEESAAQIKLRAERLGVVHDQVYLLAQTDINAAIDNARQLQPLLLIIDSVQALFNPELESAPGSVSQVRAVAAAALAFAREQGAAVMLISHVTKEGTLAGPRVLEHMVDTVLYFEGERYYALRLLRAVKNRFGSTNELGVFEMGATGLTPLDQPSAYFLGPRDETVAGSAACCVQQGTRPLLLEVQALVSPTDFSNPRRLGSGFDYNRLLMILAVLERRLGLSLGKQDVYINAAGGLRIDDPAADLAVAAAIVSSLRDVALEAHILLLGEIGLLGELRPVSREAQRLKEAAGFGFRAAIVPASGGKDEAKEKPGQIRRLPAKDLAEALSLLGILP